MFGEIQYGAARPEIIVLAELQMQYYVLSPVFL